MKKYFIYAGIAAAIIIFSGCGLPSTSTTGTKNQFTFSQSLWKTTDSGKTWIAKNVASQKPTVTDLDVLQIAINPQDPSTIYAGLRSGGMIKTTDGGEHWDFTNFTSDKVYGLVIDPKAPQTVYVSGVYQSRGKIFKTTDAGANWKEVYTKAANGPLIISLVINQKNSNVLYATTSDNEVIKSSDGGNSWQNIYEANAPVLGLAIDRSDDNLIYFLAQAGGFFKSTDGGKTVAAVTVTTSDKNFVNENFAVIKTDPTNANWVYLAGLGGIVRSRDAGKTWEKVVALDNPNTFPITALAINPANSNDIIYGAAEASYRSIDGGQNWSTFQFTTTKKASAVEYDPQNPGNIYLGFSK